MYAIDPRYNKFNLSLKLVCTIINHRLLHRHLKNHLPSMHLLCRMNAMHAYFHLHGPVMLQGTWNKREFQNQTFLS